MIIVNQNYQINFSKSRIKKYTAYQINVMRDMKKAAIKYGWCDIYTGIKFSPRFLPTIEHFIPCCKKDSLKVKLLNEKGFQINGLSNTFPAGSLGNSLRGKDDFVKTVTEQPIILQRLKCELNKYSHYKSNLIDGKIWVMLLKQTLSDELGELFKNIT